MMAAWGGTLLSCSNPGFLQQPVSLFPVRGGEVPAQGNVTNSRCAGPILQKSQYPVLRVSRSHGSAHKCPFPGLRPMLNCVADSTAVCLEERQVMPSAPLLNSWTS